MQSKTDFLLNVSRDTNKHCITCLIVSHEKINRKSILLCMLCYSSFIPCRRELQNLVLVFVCHAKEITIGHVMQCLFVSHNTFNRKSILLCMLCYSFFIPCRCELQKFGFTQRLMPPQEHSIFSSKFLTSPVI